MIYTCTCITQARLAWCDAASPHGPAACGDQGGCVEFKSVDVTSILPAAHRHVCHLVRVVEFGMGNSGRPPGAVALFLLIAVAFSGFFSRPSTLVHADGPMKAHVRLVGAARTVFEPLGGLHGHEVASALGSVSALLQTVGQRPLPGAQFRELEVPGARQILSECTSDMSKRAGVAGAEKLERIRTHLSAILANNATRLSFPVTRRAVMMLMAHNAAQQSAGMLGASGWLGDVLGASRSTGHAGGHAGEHGGVEGFRTKACTCACTHRAWSASMHAA